MNGNNVIVQYGTEATYGGGGTATKQILVSNEEFKALRTKKDEGLLTGSQIGGMVRTVAKGAEGGLSTLARPDDVGLFLALLCGAETEPELVSGSTGAYKHIFSLGEDEVLDSLFFKILKGESLAKLYSGVTIDSLSFDTKAEDLLNFSMSYKGKDESDSTLESGLSVSPLMPFRFADSTFNFGLYDMEITSIKFDFKNNLKVKQTNKSGLYYAQPILGVREISAEVEVENSADADAIRSAYWLADATTTAKIIYKNGEDIETGYPYTLTIDLNSIQITEPFDFTISSADEIKTSLKLKAVNTGVSPITITLINGYNGTYLPA